MKGKILLLIPVSVLIYIAEWPAASLLLEGSPFVQKQGPRGESMSDFSLCIKAPAAMDQGTSWEEQAALPSWADEEGARQAGRENRKQFPSKSPSGRACLRIERA